MNANGTHDVEELWGVWLDYIEGEWPPALKREIETLLVLSPEDRGRCARLKELRQLIRDSDEAHVPMDDRGAERLHDRIMARLDRVADASGAASLVSRKASATAERTRK